MHVLMQRKPGRPARHQGASYETRIALLWSGAAEKTIWHILLELLRSELLRHHQARVAHRLSPDYTMFCKSSWHLLSCRSWEPFFLYKWYCRATVGPANVSFGNSVNEDETDKPHLKWYKCLHIIRNSHTVKTRSESCRLTSLSEVWHRKQREISHHDVIPITITTLTVQSWLLSSCRTLQ